MTDNTEPTIDTLKANILTEFKQVLKLAPADYTENCTNVVMSLVDEYVSDQVAKARIEELLEQQKLLSDINKGYTRNPTNQSNYIRKAITVDKKLATINGVKK